jgi:hypothetical protein
MLTLEKFNKFQNGKPFKKGIAIDSAEGCDIGNSKDPFKWGALKKDDGSWCIYTTHPSVINIPTTDIIERGYKIYHKDNIKALINCDDEVLALYDFEFEIRKSEEKEIEEQNTFFCENTDCDGEGIHVKRCLLTEEFGSEYCYWCENCRKRDFTMIEYTLD